MRTLEIEQPVPAVAMIESLDTGIFAIQPGHYDDRTSFLRVQQLVRALRPGYDYLEIGSDIGASLLPHLLDPCCAALVSIDARPESQPDERGVDFHYAGNSTSRMLDELSRHVNPEQLARLSTIDADVSSVDPGEIKFRPHLALIDAEHTNVAAFSDFLAVLPLIAEDAIITFHDANLIGDTLRIVERLLLDRGIRHRMVILPSCVAVFGFGLFADAVELRLGPFAEAKPEYFETTRRERHETIANAVISRTPGLRASSLAELVTWTQTIEDRLGALESALASASDQATAASTANAESDALRHEVDRLRQQVVAVHGSTSWRITAPMRAAVSLLKGRA